MVTGDLEIRYTPVRVLMTSYFVIEVKEYLYIHIWERLGISGLAQIYGFSLKAFQNWPPQPDREKKIPISCMLYPQPRYVDGDRWPGDESRKKQF